MPASYPTLPRDVPVAIWQRKAWLRRFLVLLFSIPVVGAAFGLVGLREADVVSKNAGYELRVRYPELSRAGISSPVDIYARHPGGFTEPVTLRITHEYFTLFDLNGIFPAPSAETVQDGMVVWEFDPPEEDVFRVHIDWRVEPAVHSGAAANVELDVGDTFITDVSFDTRLMP